MSLILSRQSNACLLKRTERTGTIRILQYIHTHMYSWRLLLYIPIKLALILWLTSKRTAGWSVLQLWLCLTRAAGCHVLLLWSFLCRFEEKPNVLIYFHTVIVTRCMSLYILHNTFNCVCMNECDMLTSGLQSYTRQIYIASISIVDNNQTMTTGLLTLATNVSKPRWRQTCTTRSKHVDRFTVFQRL